MGEPYKDAMVRVRDILATTNSWEQCWAEGLTPWDLGEISPVVARLVREGTLPSGRALVPGCGTGYDVVAMASPTRHVTGLDISETAIKSAKEMVSRSPNASQVEFACADFFNYKCSEPFDLIFDYTFFCALEPSVSSAWGEKMAELLAPHGELITVIYPVKDHAGGPPYAVSLELYEKILHPWGLRNISYEEIQDSIERRKGLEFLGRWRRVVEAL